MKGRRGLWYILAPGILLLLLLLCGCGKEEEITVERNGKEAVYIGEK